MKITDSKSVDRIDLRLDENNKTSFEVKDPFGKILSHTVPSDPK